MKNFYARIAKMERQVKSKGPRMVVGSSREEIDAKLAEARLKYPGYQTPLVVFIRKFSESEGVNGVLSSRAEWSRS